MFADISKYIRLHMQSEDPSALIYYALACLFVFSGATHAMAGEQPVGVTASKVSSTTEEDFHVARKGLQPVVHIGLTYGGADLYSATYSSEASFTIKSGSLLEVGLGAVWQAPNAPFAAQFTLNYHTDTIFRYAIVDDISHALFDTPLSFSSPIFFQRYPVEGLFYYTGSGGWRIGGGLRYVAFPRAVGNNNGINEALYFKNTLGLVAEVGVPVMQGKAWMNIRAVSEKYQPVEIKQNGVTMPARGNSIDGSHIGINVVIPFGIGNHSDRSQSGMVDGAIPSERSSDSYSPREELKEDEKRDDGLFSGKRHIQLDSH